MPQSPSLSTFYPIPLSTSTTQQPTRSPAAPCSPHFLPTPMGLALAIATTFSTSPTLNPPPPTQLRFELAPTSAITPTAPLSTSLHRAEVYPESLPPPQPEIDQTTLIHILQSQKLLNPVLETLRQQQIHLTYAELTQGLEIRPLSQGRLEVRYQHSDAKIAQTVIQHLTQTYQAYGQNCDTHACRTLPQINAEIHATQTRIQQTQQHLATLNDQSPHQNLEHQVQWVTTRLVELESYTHQIQADLERTRQHLADLQISPAGDRPAGQHLLQQPSYLNLLQELHSVEHQLARQMLDSQPDAKQLRDLHQHHSALTQALSQEVSSILQAAVAAAMTTNQDATTDSAMSGGAIALIDSASEIDAISERLGQVDHLERSTLLAHDLNLLEQRYGAIADVQANLNRQKVDLIAQLSERDTLKQQLQMDHHLLAQHQHHRQQLHQEVQQTTVVWQLVAPPESIHI